MQIVKEAVELSEGVRPKPFVLFDPSRDVAHGGGGEVTDVLAPFAPFLDQPCALQVREVFRNRLLRHRKRLGQLVDRGWTRLEPEQDGATGRVAERSKGRAERIHNRIVVD
jgi:hypothetical protein